MSAVASPPTDTRVPIPTSSHGEVVISEFRPHPLLRAAHLQTILPSLLRPTPGLALEEERWETDDGDFVVLGWFSRPTAGQPIALLVHGLTGGFQSKYLRGTARRLQKAGWAGAVLQLRGGGDEPNRLPRSYHQGDTADLLAILQRLRADNPGSRLATIGWSLGGNIVLKAAGEKGDEHLADDVVAASVPFQIEPCVQRLNTGVSRLYQRRMLQDLKAMVQTKAQTISMPPEVDLEAVLSAPGFREYDQAFTAPLNGFADAEDYYAQTQCGNFLGQIERRTLIVHSRDDPFMAPHVVPRATELAPKVRLEISKHGGHVGFVGANRFGLPAMWLEQRIADWLSAE